MRVLASIPGTSVVGFPTSPLFLRLGAGERLVTAPEASPAEHFKWLRLLERHWIGAERGNQVSYTLKIPTDQYDLAAFRSILMAEQPRVRGCAILPVNVSGLHEYLPEEEVAEPRFRAIVAAIRDPALHEPVELSRLGCFRLRPPDAARRPLADP